MTETKMLCFHHSKEMIYSLFVGKRLVFDTNIPRHTPTQCEHISALMPRIKCTQMSNLKVTILAKSEPYTETGYLTDIKFIPKEGSKQLKLT